MIGSIVLRDSELVGIAGESDDLRTTSEQLGVLNGTMPVISWPRVIGVGMSAYFRKYPSTSCTSERHIPHALTLTRISSGWMSGTGTSSRTGGLPYSCMRAAFICVSLLALGVGSLL